MSVEFRLKGSTLDQDGWDDVLDAWVGDHDEDELYEDPAFEGEKDPVVCLWGEGSVRGVQILLEKGEAHFRLPAFASGADWRRAFEVAALALAKGGGTFTREDGRSYGTTELTKERAEKDGREDFAATLMMMRTTLAEGDATLPLPVFELQLGPNDLPKETTSEALAAFESTLAEKVGVYGTAFKASTFIIEDTKAKAKLRLATWALVPTVIGPCDYVAVASAKNVTVPLARLKAVLGARAVSGKASEATFLPELDPKTDAELIAAIEKENTKDLDHLKSEEPDPGIGSTFQTIAAALIAQAKRGSGTPEDVIKELVGMGLPEENVRVAATAIAIVMEDLLSGKTDADVRKKLVDDQGMPAALFDSLLAAVKAALAESQRPAAGCFGVFVPFFFWLTT